MALKHDDFLTLLPQAKSYGRYITGLCPFHEDSAPSLLVFTDGWYRCLGCGSHGTWKTLHNKLKGQPVQVMPDRAIEWGMPVIRPDDMEQVCYESHLDLVHFPTLGWYLELRGIDGRIESNELGYWNGWYTIPVKTENGDFITGVFRAAPHIQEATGHRYWCHHSPTMFVPDWNLFKSRDYVIVVYGMIDALLLSQMRYPVCTTTGGKDSFDGDWLDDVRKKIYIIPDLGEETIIRKGKNGRNEFGTGAPYKLNAELGWRGEVMLLDYPEGTKDCADFYLKGKLDMLNAQLSEL